MQANLDARERSLQKWERINRTEREAIGTIKTISTEELRRWVATVAEQNSRFAELQRVARQQEMQLAGPAHTYIAISAVVVLGVMGMVVHWLRDGNASAATTLDNIAGLAPEQIICSAVMARLVQPQVAPGSIPVRTAVSSYPSGNPSGLGIGETRAAAPRGGAGGEAPLEDVPAATGPALGDRGRREAERWIGREPEVGERRPSRLRRPIRHDATWAASPVRRPRRVRIERPADG